MSRAHVIVGGTRRRTPSARRFKPARSPKDWLDQEKAEVNRPARPDRVSELVGCAIYFEDYCDFSWREGPMTDPVTVTRYYPHEKLIVDKPATKEEMLRRRQLFAERRIKYFYVEKGESLDERQFLERLNKIRSNYEKAADHQRPAAGADGIPA